jgi:hypothetical protein
LCFVRGALSTAANRLSLPQFFVLLGAIALNTVPAKGLPGSSIAFPIRLHQGLLQRTDELEAYLTIIAVMARTPAGSWPSHTSFGFNEFFREVTKKALAPESRQRITLAAVQKINAVLADLGLRRYVVESLVLDAPEPEAQQRSLPQWSGHEMDRRGFTAILRENVDGRAVECAL